MTKIKQPNRVIQAGQVRRWHQNPQMSGCGENLAEHQWLTVTIMLIIEPNATREQMFSALYHDVGELAVGDLSSETKAKYPTLAKQHAEIETFERNLMVYGVTEEPLLKCADKLAGCVRMTQEGYRPEQRHWDACLMPGLTDAQFQNALAFIGAA